MFGEIEIAKQELPSVSTPAHAHDRSFLWTLGSMFTSSVISTLVVSFFANPNVKTVLDHVFVIAVAIAVAIAVFVLVVG